METKKILSIRAAVCDAREVREETLAGYDKVRLDCGILLASRESRELLNRLGVELHVANVMDADGEMKVSSINGKAEISPTQAASTCKIYLMVNGTLDIAPGSEERLKNYAGINVNGKVTCPKSMVPLLTGVTGLTVNGSIAAYPDGCIRLKKTAVLDRTFQLRAKEGGLYYAAGRVVALEPDIDFGKLAAKNIRFSAPHLLVAEGLAEAALPLFNEDAEITVLPDGCTLVSDDATLDEFLLRRCGGKLYLRGSLRVGAESAELLEQFTFLHIEGDVLAVRGTEDAVNASCARYERLRTVGGTLLCDRTRLTVSRDMLEQAEDGLSLAGCVHVTIAQDVPVELLRDRLVSVTDCVKVVCTQQQRTAIEQAAEDVVHLGPEEQQNAEPDQDENITRIQSAFYTL